MIRIAVIGPGAISRRFMEGMRDINDAMTSAFVSRHPENVRGYAAQYSVPRIMTLTDFLREKPADAVYISTPNSTHEALISACLSAGLHVLCEKPAVLTAESWMNLLSKAWERKLVLMEAQKALYLPVYQTIRGWLKENRIGTVSSARAGFCRNDHHSVDAWRMSGPGSGALYDVGCYPLSVLIGLFHPDHSETEREILSEQNGVPLSGTVTMKKEGLKLTAEYSMVQDGFCSLEVYGTEGTISCPQFWKARTCTLSAEREEVFSSSFRSEFTFEIQTFIDRIQKGIIQNQESEEISIRVLEILSG